MYIKWTTTFILLISIIVSHENTIVDRNSEKQITDDTLISGSFENEIPNSSSELEREKRAIHKFGVLRHIGTLGGLAYEQYRETLIMLQKIYNVLEDSFADTYTTTTAAPDAPTTPATNVTTTSRYRVSRKELGRLGSKNWRGLQKLARLEWQDALNMSRLSIRDYQREYANAVVAPKNYSAIFG